MATYETQLERLVEGPPIGSDLYEVIIEDDMTKAIMVTAFFLPDWAIVTAVKDAHSTCAFPNPTTTYIRVDERIIRYSPDSGGN